MDFLALALNRNESLITSVLVRDLCSLPLIYILYLSQCLGHADELLLGLIWLDCSSSPPCPHRYQWLAMNHLSDHARMPDSDFAILARMTLASWEDRPFENVALDECMELFNRIIKQALHRITPGYIRQLGPIVENRKITIDEVEHRFYKPGKAQNTVETLVKDRQKRASKAADFLLDCDAFRETGRSCHFP